MLFPPRARKMFGYILQVKTFRSCGYHLLLALPTILIMIQEHKSFTKSSTSHAPVRSCPLMAYGLLILPSHFRARLEPFPAVSNHKSHIDNSLKTSSIFRRKWRTKLHLPQTVNERELRTEWRYNFVRFQSTHLPQRRGQNKPRASICTGEVKFK